MTAADYIQHLQMQPHPEGGYYKEIFRSDAMMAFPGFDGPRPLATSILFLLESGQRSALHRIKSDEIWYHHDGGTIEIIELDEEGNECITRLGKNLSQGDVLQYVVKANTCVWCKAAKRNRICIGGMPGKSGFDFRDFELK